jgi:hypothetical protein
MFRVIENTKLVSEKLQEAIRDQPRVQRRYNQINMEVRTMDKVINTIRPQLMKLLNEKEHYVR